MLLCPVVAGVPAQTAPPSPVEGSCHLVGDDATGAWSGHDGALACFTDGGWRYAAPVEGMSVIDGTSGQTLAYRNGTWEAGIARAQEVRIDGLTVLRNRQPAIANPAGGNTLDVECRATVTAILVTLRAHGLIA
jgi:hypothetical protein